MSVLKNSVLPVLLIGGFLLSINATAQEAAEQPGLESPQAESTNKITKSRSNIQNNREGVQPAEEAPVDPAVDVVGDQVIKTKTKSNQSND